MPPIKKRDLTKKYTIGHKTASGEVWRPHSHEPKFKKTVDASGKEIPTERRRYSPSAAGKLNERLSLAGTAEELFVNKFGPGGRGLAKRKKQRAKRRREERKNRERKK